MIYPYILFPLLLFQNILRIPVKSSYFSSLFLLVVYGGAFGQIKETPEIFFLPPSDTSSSLSIYTTAKGNASLHYIPHFLVHEILALQKRE